jgi:hypothetical protein
MGEYSEAFVAFDTSKTKHAVAIAGGGRGGEVRFLGDISSSPAAVERLIRKLAGRYDKLHLRYEAGRTGYGLYRRIQTLGHACLVIAPALIPKRPGERVKTNRRDADWPRLRQWEDGAAAQGLAWERHAGRVPRDVLVALLAVFTELFADVPLGGLETGPIRWKMNGYDLWYETLERVGGAHHLVLLRAPDGSVAGLSEAGWDSRTPSIVRQQLTAVARP